MRRVVLCSVLRMARQQRMMPCCCLARSVGEKRRLKVPAHLAYQDKGHADLGVPGGHPLFSACMQDIVLKRPLWQRTALRLWWCAVQRTRRCSSTRSCCRLRRARRSSGRRPAAVSSCHFEMHQSAISGSNDRRHGLPVIATHCNKQPIQPHKTLYRAR